MESSSSHNISDQRRKSTGHGILKQSSGVHLQHQENGHIKFDEEIIAEHDKSRGTRQKIEEPKTPYANDDLGDMQDADEQSFTANANVGVNINQDVHMHDQSSSQEHHTIVHIDANQQKVEEEVKRHLEEAERNKQLNAQLQKEKAQSQLGGVVGSANFNEQLMQKLDNTQQELDEEERKHREFLQKRKEHYKNELKAAQMLRQQSHDEEEEDDQ